MPVDSTYQKYYGALQQAYGKDGTVEKGAFNLGYDDFKQKLSNQEYAQKIYGALDQAYGKQGVAEKGAFTLPFKDFYSKLTTPNMPQKGGGHWVQQEPIQQSNPNFDISPNSNPNVSHYQNPYDNLKSISLPHQGELITKNAHSDRVQEATNNITDVFNNNKDKAIVKIVSGDLSQKQRILDASFQDGQIDEKTYKEQKKQLFGQMMNPAAAVNQFKQDMSSDQGKVRQVVNEIANSNPDKANKIKADMYVLDSKDRGNKAEKILSNAENIEKGKTDYNIKSANLQNHEGFFSSLGQGFSERNRMMNDYDFYTGETPDKIIGKLEHQRNSYDPDEPVNAPYGIGGHLGQAIGSQGIVTAKGAISGGLTSLIPVVGEASAPWVAAAVTSPEFYKTGYVSSLENEYHRLRNQGIPEDEALQKAKDKAEFDAKVDVAQGVLATAVGTRIGLKPTELPPTFQKSITNIAKHAGTWLGETGVEGGANAIIAGGLQELKNIHSGRPAEEGAFETGMGQLMFAYGLGALTKGGRALLNPKAYGSILRTMAKAPDEKVSAELANMVKSGSISAEDATDVHNQLTQQRATDSKIPDHITNDKDRAKIQELIGQRDQLDSKIENLDKAYHPDIKEQIKTINEKIADLSKNPTEPTGKPSSEPTFKEPEDQTRLYVNDQIQKGNKDWTKNDIYVNMAKQDPEGFMKFISDQSTPEIRGHTEDVFGKELVQKAIDLYHPKTETNGKDQGRADEAQADQRQIVQPEGAQATAPGQPASSLLESRHANTVDDEHGKVSGPNNNPLSKGGKRDANDLAKEAEGKGVTKIITSDLERSKETGRIVGEKTGAKVEHDPALNTWDIGEFDKASDEDFKKAQEYFVAHPDSKEFEGKKINESFNEYKDRIIKARTELENEPSSTLVVNHSNNMMLWDAYLKNGRQWNESAANDYLNAKSPEPATLKEQNVSYPKITNVKLKENVQIGRPEKVLQREPEQAGSSGSGRWGMEPSQQGNEAAGARNGEEKSSEGAGKEKVEEDWPFVEEEGDNEVTSIKNAVTREKIEKYGLTPALQEAKRALPEVWDEAVKKINKGYDPQFLVDQLKKKPRPITDTEDALLLYHQATKEAELEDINKSINDIHEKGTREDFEELQTRKAKVLDDLQDIYDVDKKVGTANARGLNARKMMVDRRFSLVNMMAERRAAQEGEPLTQEQQSEVEKKYNALKEANAAVEKRIAELQAENEALKNKKAQPPTEVKETKPKKTKGQYSEERKNILKDIRNDLLRAAKGGEGLTSSIPLAAQLKAIAPHIPKLVKNLVAQGIDTLEGVTKEILGMLKGDVPELTESHVHDLIAGEFNEAIKKVKQPSKTTEIKQEAKKIKYAITDPKLMKLRADYERQKAAWGDALRKAELNKRSKAEKARDVFIKWERASKLSGITTLAKLAMAGATRIATTPIEEAIGGAISKVLPKSVSSKASGESGFNVKAQAKSIASIFTQGLKDSYDILSKGKRGKSDIESVFGKNDELPPEAISFFGQLHSAIKAPIKRAAFTRSMEKRLAANIENGVDVSDPMVQTKIAVQAYKDANRAIFMQDNIVSDAYKRAINALEKNKQAPALGKTISTGLQWLIPFVKVPTNIIGEVQQHTTGIFEGAARLGYQAIKNGLENISEDESDAILRAFKKGSIGAGALLLGYFNPNNFGGFYQKGEKQTPDKLKPGSAKVGGVKVPIWLLEAPLFQTMQLGATIRKLSDFKLSKESSPLWQAAIASELDLMGHEPLIDQPARISKLFTEPKERQYFLGELAKGSIVPTGLSDIAKFTDKADTRKPSTITEHIETGIPGLREKVPAKAKSHH